jgi:hypothetical protein
MNQDGLIHNSLAVAPAGPQALYILTTYYPESDALNPAGQLLQHMLNDSALTESTLSTASPLATMWHSASGHLWLAGADGSAWTTAPVSWPQDGPAFEAATGGPTWTSTRLPRLAANGAAPNISAIGGESDTAVFFASTAGVVYRWDGSDWSQSSVGSDASLTKLGGRRSDDMYAVGYRGTVAHWDGKGWTLVPTPGLAAASTIVTGIALRENGDVFASTNRGQLLQLTAAGFVIAATTDRAHFTGLAASGSELIVSSDTGAWGFDGATLRQIKDNFAATNVQAVGDRLYFIETEQPHGPACVEYLPARHAGSPWQRLVF